MEDRTNISGPSLRTRLREETRAAHLRLDEIAKDLDLAHYADVSIFAVAHHAAYSALDKAFQGDFALTRLRLDKATQDIHALGLPTTGLAIADIPSAMSELGVTYVIAGSHLGAKVLTKQWSKTRDPRVNAASHLLRDEVLEREWAAVLTTLKSLPATGRGADDVVAGAIACFDLFRAAFNAARTMRTPDYVVA